MRFNPRAHGGRDTKWMRETNNESVSIHAPTGGATFFHLPRRAFNQFQSTRPRGARLRAIDDNTVQGFVSIHAPTGGATFRMAPSKFFKIVSIHAPTGGATCY